MEKCHLDLPVRRLSQLREEQRENLLQRYQQQVTPLYLT
jgi:hypothetical protein